MTADIDPRLDAPAPMQPVATLAAPVAWAGFVVVAPVVVGVVTQAPSRAG